MNKRLLTTITVVLLVATGCAGDGNADDQLNRNAEKLAERIAELRDGRASKRVSPEVVISELGDLSGGW